LTAVDEWLPALASVTTMTYMTFMYSTTKDECVVIDWTTDIGRQLLTIGDEVNNSVCSSQNIGRQLRFIGDWLNGDILSVLKTWIGILLAFLLPPSSTRLN